MVAVSSGVVAPAFSGALCAALGIVVKGAAAMPNAKKRAPTKMYTQWHLERKQ